MVTPPTPKWPLRGALSLWRARTAVSNTLMDALAVTAASWLGAPSPQTGLIGGGGGDKSHGGRSAGSEYGLNLPKNQLNFTLSSHSFWFKYIYHEGSGSFEASYGC